METLEYEFKRLCDDDEPFSPNLDPLYGDEDDLEDLTDPSGEPGPWGWDDDPA